jgi:hypothetical protein
MWMTNITIQGDGEGTADCDSCAIHVSGGASLYAKGGLSVQRLQERDLQVVYHVYKQRALFGHCA